jgi:DNA-binding transcriptional LysR family regulator
MGTCLLTRSGRTVAPTEAGYRLVDGAATILRDLGNLKASINDDAATGELRLGAINTANTAGSVRRVSVPGSTCALMGRSTCSISVPTSARERT